jgi:plastocyanin
MRLRDAPLGLAALAAVLPAAGCGTSEAAAPTATTRVTMAKSYRFEPRAIAVPVGATVTWTNDDNFTHSVHVDGQEDHTVEPGERVSISFPTAGTYHYVCRLHRRDMDGEVVVG